MSPQPEGIQDIRDELRRIARSLLVDPRNSAPATPGDPLTFPAPSADLLADVGWLGLEVTAHLGGSEATVAETMVVCEEMGRALCQGPYLGTAVLGIGALHLADDHPCRDDLLRQAVAGRAQLALALPPPTLGPAPAPFRAEPADGGHRLVGRADVVVDGGEADHLLLPVVTVRGIPALACVHREQPGVTVTSRPLLDLTRTVATVEANGAPVDDDRLWGWRVEAGEALQRLLARGSLAVAADSLGLITAVLDRTVAYTKEREQFGRPVGSFQAVKHACADMLVAAELSRALLDEAVAGCGPGAPDDHLKVSMAKSYIDEAAVAAAGKAMQLHGGIGYTWDAGIHAYLKRAAMNRSLFGSPLWHRRRIATELLQTSGRSEDV